MSTNLNEQYLSHDLIRRRMRWTIMLLTVLSTLLFVTYENRDKANLKGFMLSTFNNATAPLEGQPPATGVDKHRDIAVPARVGVVLWDERNNGNSANISLREPISELCQASNAENSKVCRPGSIEETASKSAQGVPLVPPVSEGI